MLTSEETKESSAVEIKGRSSSFNAPTPANTPLTAAPITSKQFKTSLSTMSEQVSSILSQNPQLMSALQGRLGQLVGQSSGYIESLPQEIKDRIASLEVLQAEHRKLNSQFDREVLALEKKYQKLYAPLYEKRSTIVSGKEETPAAEDKGKQSEIAGGIPEFWLTIFKNSQIIEQLLRECDEEVLKSLLDIRCTLLEENPGFLLEFEFAENEFFSNKVLTRTYFLEDSTEDADFMFDRAEGSPIEWKEGKDLTVKVELKKQRNKNTKQTRVVKKTVPNETFFNFFSPPEMPEEEEEDEEAEEIHSAIQFDYEVGEHFKDDIIPRAIDWFTGKAAQEFMEDNDEEDYDDEDEDDEEEEEEQDSDDEPRASVNQTGEKPECKQQ